LYARAACATVAIAYPSIALVVAVTIRNRPVPASARHGRLSVLSVELGVVRKYNTELILVIGVISVMLAACRMQRL
jgi:hypothetical protein